MAIGALAAVGLSLDIIGRLRGGQAAEERGEADSIAALFEASQLEQLAGQEEAVGQRRALEERRLGRLRSSRALARSAASGGGVATNIIADLDAQADFLARLALFGGKDRARLRRTQAQIKRFEAKSSRRAGRDARSASIFGIGATLFSKFGES